MTTADLSALLDRLRAEPPEAEWLEFGANRYESQLLGEHPAGAEVGPDRTKKTMRMLRSNNVLAENCLLDNNLALFGNKPSGVCRTMRAWVAKRCWPSRQNGWKRRSLPEGPFIRPAAPIICRTTPLRRELNSPHFEPVAQDLLGIDNRSTDYE
jgi:hypothetical protein